MHTYAAGSPWLHFGSGCHPDPEKLREWVHLMTGRTGSTHRAPHSFGGWPTPPPAPWGPPMWGGGRGGWRGSKARRGDVRAAILSLLAEKPMNGYQLIQEVVARSDGAWKPSPGSVYPTLQQLEDEKLIRPDTTGDRRAFTLTDEGRQYVADHPDEIAAPWQSVGEANADEEGLKPLIGQVAAAIWQLMAVGSPEQQAKGREALLAFRRTLHNILAESDEDKADK